MSHLKISLVFFLLTTSLMWIACDRQINEYGENGEKKGFWTEKGIDGKVSQGYYSAGVPIGEWETSDSLGKLFCATSFFSISENPLYTSKTKYYSGNDRVVKIELHTRDGDLELEIPDSSLYFEYLVDLKASGLGFVRAKGAALLEFNCISCHASEEINSEFLIGGFLCEDEVTDFTWVRQFILNSDDLYSLNDSATKIIYEKYPLHGRHKFQMSSGDIQAIVAYVRKVPCLANSDD